MMSGEHGRDSAGSVGTVGLNGVGDKGVLICSPAELRKRVGLIPSGVDRFVGTVGLNLPEELATNCSEALETPMNEGFVRG